MPSAVETFPNQFTRPRLRDRRSRARNSRRVCPKTGQPLISARIYIIQYVPAAACLELKSLKLYLVGYRDRGIFYEHVVNTILDDLTRSCQPRKLKVIGQFNLAWRDHVADHGGF